jgi:hypothetical protein
MNKRSLIPIALVTLLAILDSRLAALAAPGTAFTYQGLLELEANGIPVTGLYDFNFNLFTISSGGTALNAGVTNTAVGVTNGLFMTTIDFGSVFDGTRYWLEIGSRQNNGGGAFQIMQPRVELTPVPYAVFAETTRQLANNSVTAANIVVPLQLSGNFAGAGILSGTNSDVGGYGIVGVNSATGIGAGAGVAGQGKVGVSGQGSATGVSGSSISASGTGVAGSSPSGDGVYGTSGQNGVHGVSSSASGNGVSGENTGNGTGVAGSSGGGYGVAGSSSSSYGVLGTSSIGDGVSGSSTSGNGVSGGSQDGSGVRGDSQTGAGVYGQSYSGVGVSGRSGLSDGVSGSSDGNGKSGVYGVSSKATGYGGYFYNFGGGEALHAEGNGAGDGVVGRSASGDGVWGHSDGAGKSGVYGDCGSASGFGGYFVNVGGGQALHTEGDAYINGSATVKCLTINGGCDVAEPFQMSSQKIAKGAVVVIDDENAGQLKLSDRPYDERVAGIVSGANGINPGIALHQDGVLEGGQNVALSGRVYVLADASSSPIKPGDLLTTSSVPGHAMKVTDQSRAHGAIIGKAMSPLGQGKGMVLVLVTLQ